MKYSIWPEELLAEYNLKKTSIRLEVLTIFFKHNQALALNELEKLVDFKQHRVSIYRVLKDFSRVGLLCTFYDAWGNVRYELNNEKFNKSNAHGHFSCTNCQKVFCFNGTDINFNGLPKNFHTSKVNVLLEGLCPSCHVQLKLNRTMQSILQ